MNRLLQQTICFFLLVIPPLLGGCQEVPAREASLDVHTGAGDVVSYQVELAETEQQKRRGLMHRKNMPDNRGMLFLYEPARETRMWMKNTLLSLDILFIDQEGRIIRIAKNTEPMSTRTISSGGKVRAVLELNAGQATAHGIEVGDKVVW